MKTLKERVKEGVPQGLQRSAEFTLFLRLLSTEKLLTKTSVKKFLKTAIRKAEQELHEIENSSTANRIRVRLARKIKLLKKFHDEFLSYFK